MFFLLNYQQLLFKTFCDLLGCVELFIINIAQLWDDNKPQKKAKLFFIFDNSVCFLLKKILNNAGIDFVNHFQSIKNNVLLCKLYYSETISLSRFCSFQHHLMFNFGVVDVLVFFLFLCQYKNWRIPNGLISLIQWCIVGTFC